jgi:hypothetical protein
MHWLLQSNLATDEQRQQYVDALDTLKPLGATWSFIKLIPFAGDVEPDNDYTGKKVFALGSTSLILAAQKRGWLPGVIFDPVTFRHEAWLSGWGRNNLLNGNGYVARFGDPLPFTLDCVKIFIRPCEDLKAFSGHVIEAGNLRDWQKRVRDGEVSTRALQLSSDTKIVIAPVHNVLREWRFFVVGGKVITGSQYRTYFSTYADRSAGITADVPADVTTFAQAMADRWSPAACFVLDVGEISTGLRVIEANCLNGSGLYACDFAAVCAAVEKLYGP